jgi:hypothetical protein
MLAVLKTCDHKCKLGTMLAVNPYSPQMVQVTGIGEKSAEIDPLNKLDLKV